MEGSQLAEIFATQGMAPGYMRGEKQGTDLAATIAATRQQGLASDRFAAETPDYLAQQGYSTEKARLGNVAEQEYEKIGGQAHDAQAKLLKSKNEAAQAQHTWDTMPGKYKLEMLEQNNKENQAMLGSVANILQTGGTKEQVLQHLQKQFPDKFDLSTPEGQKALQAYRNSSPQQILQITQQRMEQIATSTAKQSAEVQAKMLEEDNKHSNDMALDAQGNRSAMSIAQLNAASGERQASMRGASGGGSMNATEAKLMLMQQLAQETDPAKRDYIVWQINALGDNANQGKRNIVTGEMEGGNMIAPPLPVQAPASGGSDLAARIAAEKASRTATPAVRPTPRPTNDIDRIKAESAAKRRSQDAAMAAMYKKYSSLDRNSAEAKNLLTQINKLAASTQ